jgi:hypothetical protein
MGSRIATFVISACIAVAAAVRPSVAEDLRCCGTVTCPPGTAQVGDDQCCDGDGCQTVSWLGKHCEADLVAVGTGIPDRGNLAGCLEEPGVACIGGAIRGGAGPIAGCVCVGEACEADVDFPNGGPACTRIAVDACCRANACR